MHKIGKQRNIWFWQQIEVLGIFMRFQKCVLFFVETSHFDPQNGQNRIANESGFSSFSANYRLFWTPLKQITSKFDEKSIFGTFLYFTALLATLRHFLWFYGIFEAKFQKMWQKIEMLRIFMRFQKIGFCLEKSLFWPPKWPKTELNGNCQWNWFWFVCGQL